MSNFQEYPKNGRGNTSLAEGGKWTRRGRERGRGGRSGLVLGNERGREGREIGKA